MKKLISALLVALLILSGCNGKSDIRNASVEKQYAALAKYLTTVKSLEADVELTMKLDKESQSMDMEILLENIQKPKELLAAVDMTITGFSIEGYYADSMIYMDLLGMKMKMDMVEALKSVPTPEGTNIEQLPNLGSLTESLKEIADSTTSEVDGENVILTLELDLKDAIGDFDSFIKDQELYGDITYTKYEMTLITEINKYGELLSNEVVIVLEFMSNGEEASIEIEAAIDYININKTKVELPKDLDEYKDMDEYNEIFGG